MRLAIVSPYPPSKGTLNEYNFHLVNHFQNKVMIDEIHLLTDTLPNGIEYDINDLKEHVFVHECWSFNSYINCIKLIKKISAIKADVVLFNIQFLTFGDKKIPAALGLMIPLMLRIMGKHSVVLLHNIMEEVDLEQAGISNNRILQFIYNQIGTILTKFILQADLVTVTIAKYVEVLKAKYKKENIALIPHGSFEIPPMPDFNAPYDKLRVMTFGKFGTYKKVEVLIEAVELVRNKTGKEIELVIAGSDNPNCKGYLASMQEKYKEVKDIVYTGYVAEEDVPQLFQESSVVVFPYSGTTGSSGILHQAGSYGKATIFPNIGDFEKLVKEEGYKGEYFTPENAVSLSHAIEKVLMDEDYRLYLAKQNYIAAVSLPMEDLTDWYYLHFMNILNKKMNKKSGINKEISL